MSNLQVFKMESTSSTKRKKKVLTIHEKMEILKNLENGVKNREICKKYNVQSSTVSTILKSKEKIEEHHAFMQSVGSDLSRKRLRGTDYDVLDQIVFGWFNQRRANGEPVSGVILQSVAKAFHEKLAEQGLVQKNQFKASTGWLAKFKKRHGLNNLQAKGEVASVNKEESDSFIVKFEQFLFENEYELDDIYNGDEGGLIFKSLPNETLVSANENEVYGYNLIEDRVTFMTCANATGTHAIPLMLIGKAKKPKCFNSFGNRALPIDYIHQKKAWMSKKTFIYWFKNVFLGNVRKTKPNGRILLLLDNAPSHPSAEELNEIDPKCQVMYLPPNFMSLVQPMNQGIISALKRRYKTGFLLEMLSRNHKINAEFVQSVKKWSILDCMFVLRESWGAVTQSTLRNAWKKLLPNHLPDFVCDFPSNTELISLLNRVPGGEVCSATTVIEWLEDEREKPAFEVMTDNHFLNTYAGLELSVDEDSCQSSNSSDKEEDEEVETNPKASPTIESVLNIAQAFLDWTRGIDQFTDEERQGFLKARNIALNALLFP